MLRRVGLAERLNHYPKVLSGGEQQRVALARAFVVEPAVLLADEPTGSLDFATGEKVMELMFELNRERGTTLVLVTHDAGIARRCDRQIRIEAGQGGQAAGRRDAREYDRPMTSKLLFGFHAVTVRLKTAPQSVLEIHIDATRRDQRMRQFVARAQEAGARMIESDDERLQKMCGTHRHQGVVAMVQPMAQARSLDDLLDSIEEPRRCCWCSTA